MDKDQQINRAMALDVFATAYHKADDIGVFLIGVVCALVDAVGVEQSVSIFAAGLAFDRQESTQYQPVLSQQESQKIN